MFANKASKSCCKVCLHKQKTLPDGAPVHQQKLKDKTCCIIFILFVFIWFIIGMVAYSSGNPASLIFGSDYQGNICSSSNSGLTVNGVVVNSGKGGRDQTLNPYIAFPQIGIDVISSQDNGFDPNNAVATIDNLHLSGVCVPSCPQTNDWVCFYDAEDAISGLKGDAGRVTEPVRSDQINLCFNTLNPTGACLTIVNGCFKTSFPTADSFWRCVPSTSVLQTTATTCAVPGPLPPNLMNNCVITQQVLVTKTRAPNGFDFLFNKLNTVSSTWTKNLSDVQKAIKPTVLLGILYSIGFSFVIAYLMKLFPGCTVWLILMLVVLVSFAGMLCFYNKSGAITLSNIGQALNVGLVLVGQNNVTVDIPNYLAVASYNTQYYNTAGNLFVFITFLLVVVILGIEKKVEDAVDILRESSKVLYQIPFLVFFPVFTIFFIFLLGMWFSSVAVNLASMTNLLLLSRLQSSISQALGNSTSLAPLVNVTQFIVDQSSNKNAFTFLDLWHFFGLLWLNSFIHGIAMATVAGAVSSFYWARNKEDVSRHALLDSWIRVVRYNLGSVAAASCFLSIFQFVRMFLEFFNRKARELQSRHRCIDCFYKLIRGVVLLFDVILHFVSKSSFVLIGMCGTSFLTSAGEATSLIYHHSTGAAGMNSTAQIITFLGKLLVAFSSCLILFFHLETNSIYQSLGSSQLNSDIAPLMMCFIFSFFISSAFFYMYDSVMDTLLLCYCYDLVHVEGEHFFTEQYKERVEVFKASKTRYHKENGALETISAMKEWAPPKWKDDDQGSVELEGEGAPLSPGKDFAIEGEDGGSFDVEEGDYGENFKRKSLTKHNPVKKETVPEKSKQSSWEDGGGDFDDEGGIVMK